MKLKFIRAFLLMGMVFYISGCASFLTMMSPVQSEIVVGEKSPGEFNKYQYQSKIISNQIIISKTPLCGEKAIAYRSAQKRQIGFGPALLEMPLFGLGLIDIINARAIAEDSKKQYLLAEYDTGELLACGRPEPAAGEAFIIENSRHDIRRKGVTDNKGVLDLKSILRDLSGVTRITIYPESDPGVRFSYVLTSPKLDARNFSNPYIYKN